MVHICVRALRLSSVPLLFLSDETFLKEAGAVQASSVMYSGPTARLFNKHATDCTFTAIFIQTVSKVTAPICTYNIRSFED